MELKHGSIEGFFGAYGADIVCLQARTAICPILKPGDARLRRRSVSQQEAKVPEAKLTKEIACIQGFEASLVLIAC